MKAIQFDRVGEPLEVLQANDVPMPQPRGGEVRVRMIASPINPSDLMTVRGIYVGTVPTPFIPGYEGVGVVESAGPGLLGKAFVGRRVAVLNQAGGNWAEFAVVPAIRAIPVPSDLPDAQVASFFVNPVTVLAMVRHVLKVPKGGWLLQSAAGSTLGRMIIRLGRHDGFRTLNVVRRTEAIAELKDLGADAVISSSDGPIADQVRAIAGDEVRHAVDPVGGATAAGILEALGDRGRMLVYGTLERSPTIPLDPRKMIATGKAVQGFYLGHWAARRNKLKMLGTFREVAQLIRSGVLASELGREFPLEAIGEAVAEAETVGRKGKVLLRIGSR